MNETLKTALIFLVNTFPIWGSVLFILIVKYFPKVDRYFKVGLITLENVDDLLDRLLLEYPDNILLSEINEYVDMVIEELKDAGYKVTESDMKMIGNRVKANIAREIKNKSIDVVQKK